VKQCSEASGAEHCEVRTVKTEITGSPRETLTIKTNKSVVFTYRTMNAV